MSIRYSEYFYNDDYYTLTYYIQDLTINDLTLERVEFTKPKCYRLGHFDPYTLICHPVSFESSILEQVHEYEDKDVLLNAPIIETLTVTQTHNFNISSMIMDHIKFHYSYIPKIVWIVPKRKSPQVSDISIQRPIGVKGYWKPSFIVPSEIKENIANIYCRQLKAEIKSISHHKVSPIDISKIDGINSIMIAKSHHSINKIYNEESLFVSFMNGQLTYSGTKDTGSGFRATNQKFNIISPIKRIG